MASYAQRTQFRNGGIPLAQWIENFIRPLSETEGKGILFNNLVLKKAENRANYYGNAPVVEGTPFTEMQAINYFEDSINNQNTCFVPTSLANEKTNAMFSQCGATWVGQGRPFDVGYNDQYITLMYLGAIQSAIWTLVNEEKVSEVSKWINMVIDLCHAAKSYFKYNKKAFAIVEPLRESEDAIDMFGRAIAFIFFEDNWTTEELLRILEVSLKRWYRNTTEPDFVINPIFEIIGIILAVPILRELIRGNKTTDNATNELNEKTMYLMKVMAENITKQGPELNKIFLYELTQQSDLKHISNENIIKLYDWCLDANHLTELAPLSDWGLVLPTVLPFNTINSGKVDTNYITTKSKFRNIDNENFKLSSTAPSDWTPVQLLTPGIYKFNGKQVGDASIGQGNTNRKTNTSLIRFTTGDDVLPRKGTPIEGMSSAGMHYSQKNGIWDFRNIGKPLDVLCEFTVTIKKDGSFSIVQDGNTWYEVKRANFDTPVMIGFKFLEFIVSYNELQNDPVPDVGDDMAGLTGIALMKRLAAMKLGSQ